MQQESWLYDFRLDILSDSKILKDNKRDSIYIINHRLKSDSSYIYVYKCRIMYQMELGNRFHRGGNYCKLVDRFVYFVHAHETVSCIVTVATVTVQTQHTIRLPKPLNFPSFTQYIPLPASPATIRATINIKHSIFGKPQKA